MMCCHGDTDNNGIKKAMNYLANTLERGRIISILRHDGRKHPAIISDIDHESERVLVEWNENNETKAKEIEFIQVYDLNPLLRPKQSVENKKISQQTVSKCGSNDKVFNSRPLNDGKTVILERRLHENKINDSYENSENMTNQQVSNDTNRNLPKNISRMSMVPTTSMSDSNVTRKPKTSLLIEIEKLKKNREERRQRQAEVREEQKTLMSIYPKNNNWKFGKMITDFQSTLQFNPLRGIEPVESRQITVCVRKRPLNKREIGKSEIDVISVPKTNVIIVHEPKSKVDLTKYLDNQHFYFDYAFDEQCDNEIVYKYTAKPLIETIFEGGMATCFAYGQTGSGKTHTMGGNFSKSRNQDIESGIYVMSAKDIFEIANSPKYQNKNFIISATFFEIYQGKLFDLLAKKARLKILDDGKQQVHIVGLTEKAVTGIDGVLSLLKIGNAVRASGKTSANSNSSRSHAVFQIIIRLTGLKKVYGKFSLIDLAGNERMVDTSTANKTTRMEGAEINKSLLALKECIRALGRRGAHLPFRQSKLTLVLRDSFVGEKSKTCMIAMISPGMSSCEHTLNTLRYADRVKELESNDLEDYNYDLLMDKKKQSRRTLVQWADDNLDIFGGFSLQDEVLPDDVFMEMDYSDEMQDSFS